MTVALAEAFTNTTIAFMHAIPIGLGAIGVAYAIGLDPNERKFWVFVMSIQLIAGGLKLGIVNAST
jgi:hypothetical protein